VKGIGGGGRVREDFEEEEGRCWKGYNEEERKTGEGRSLRGMKARGRKRRRRS